jgi:hypothetical protein
MSPTKESLIEVLPEGNDAKVESSSPSTSGKKDFEDNT